MRREACMFSQCKERFIALNIVFLLLVLTSSALSGVAHKMYVPHPFDSEGAKSVVSVYDLKDSRLISTILSVPAAMLARVTPDGKFVWIFSSKEREVEVYSVATDELVGKPYLDGPACDAVFDPDGKICYTANGSRSDGGDNSISYIDVESQIASYTIATGTNPVSLAIQKDGSRLYVANQGDNSITVIDPKQFRVDMIIYAGIEPNQVVLSNTGRYLFVANRGVDFGRSGGSCVIVIETETGKVVRVIETGNGPSSIGLTPDGGRMVVCHVDHGRRDNLWYYDMTAESGGVAAELIGKITFGKGAEYGTVGPSGDLFVVPDHLDGGIYAVDMLRPGAPSRLANLYAEKAHFVEFAAVDIDSELAIRDSIIQKNPAGAEAQDAAFQQAYLHRTAGDQNAVVTAYNSIVEKFPGTMSEAKALFALGDLCYDQQLVSNAADYYNRGLLAYGEILKGGTDKQTLPSGIILEASERLGELAVQLDENYFVDLYKLYGSVPMKLTEFPQLFFTFGISLKKLGDSKFAKKCFEETENRLIELMDESLYQEMKIKIDLVKSDARAMFYAARVKGAITLDGSLDDWGKADALLLNSRDDVVVNQMRWLDKTDISGLLYVGYDQYNFYVAGDIDDDRVFRQDSASGDYVGVYLDLREGSGNYLTREREIGEGVYLIRVIPPADPGGEFSVQCEQEMEPMIGGMMSSDGYVFELKIPLAYLTGFSPAKRKQIGVGIELFDLDSGNSNDPPKVVGWLMPAKSAYGPRYSELFGILEF
jgi:YVTN family beta-propeller protein